MFHPGNSFANPQRGAKYAQDIASAIRNCSLHFWLGCNLRFELGREDRLTAMVTKHHINVVVSMIIVAAVTAVDYFVVSLHTDTTAQAESSITGGNIAKSRGNSTRDESVTADRIK